MNRLMLTVMILATVAGAAFAGGSGESGDAEPLSVMIIDNNKTPKEEGSLTDNRWTRWIKEEMSALGIAVKFVPKGASLVRHTLMMATRAAPDLSFTHGRLLFIKFASDGGLHDLGQYLEEYGSNIEPTLGRDILDYGVFDGTQYAIPSRRDSIAKNVSFIRKDWLDALGLAVPETKNELVEVLRAFRDQDPGGIGSDRLIPWGYITDDPGTVFESDFKLFDVMYSFLKPDALLDVTSSWPFRDGFKDFMGWMNQLYHEGLIEREFATDNFDVKNRKIVAGQVGFFHVPYNHMYGQDPNGRLANLLKNVPEAEVVPIEVFENPAGDYPKLLNHPVRYYAFSPKRSKHPEAAVAYLNWLADERIGWTLTFGVEGEHYDLTDGMPIIRDLEYTRNTFDYISGYLRILGDYPIPQPIRTAYTDQRRVYDFGGNDTLAQEMALSEGFSEFIFQEPMPEMMKRGPGLIKICEKYWVKMIVEDDFDAAFDEFIDKLKSRNIEDIIEERVDYYDRNYR